MAILGDFNVKFEGPAGRVTNDERDDLLYRLRTEKQKLAEQQIGASPIYDAIIYLLKQVYPPSGKEV